MAGVALAALVATSLAVVWYRANAPQLPKASQEQARKGLDVVVRDDPTPFILTRDLSDSPPTYFPHAVETRSLYFTDATGAAFSYHAALFASGADALECYNGFAARNHAEGTMNPKFFSILSGKTFGAIDTFYLVELGNRTNSPIIQVWEAPKFEDLSRFQISGVVRLAE